jgi:hypothetical protein
MCHVLNATPLCVEEIVADKNTITQYGKATDPVTVQGITMLECMTHGEERAREWATQHPVYRTWELRGWKCAPGDYTPQGRA